MPRSNDSLDSSADAAVGTEAARLAQSKEFVEFERENSAGGRLGRYLKGRYNDLGLRILMNALASIGLAILIDPVHAAAVFVAFLSADLLECSVFYRLYERGHRFWETRLCRIWVLGTSIVVAALYSGTAASVWHAQEDPSRFLAVTLMAGFSMNAGFFVYLFRPANVVKQSLFLLTALALFLRDYVYLDPSSADRFWADLLASFAFAICLATCYSRLRRFAGSRYQSERSLLISKLEAEHVTEMMHHRARHDSLTGLPNRAYLADFMAKMMKIREETGDHFAIFHIDLDKFKEVNDSAGHAAGDAVLKSASGALKKSVRDRDFVARIGGDEFVVVTEIGVKEEELLDIAERIISKISKPIMFMDQELRVGASVGFALSQAYHETGEAVLLDADLALYEAKEDGRGVARAFAPFMRSEFENRTRIVADLTRGIEKGEIETVFQPQVDLHKNLVAGFEALVRWRHPTLGLLSPDKFVKLAEEAGLLKEITFQVAQQSFEALQIWRNAGFQVPSIGLNFASRQLEDREMISQVKWMVEVAGLAPEDVTIEVLESVLSSENSDDLISNIKSLSAAGFSIDLDDFGTEHASIANMRSFEVQRIKIDKSFIQDIEKRPDQRRLVSAMVQLARSLNVHVLAEGVESGAEIEILSSLGCDQVQGYFFARPMTLENSLDWLANCGLIERTHVDLSHKAALF